MLTLAPLAHGPTQEEEEQTSLPATTGERAHDVPPAHVASADAPAHAAPTSARDTPGNTPSHARDTTNPALTNVHAAHAHKLSHSKHSIPTTATTATTNPLSQAQAASHSVGKGGIHPKTMAAATVFAMIAVGGLILFRKARPGLHSHRKTHL